MSDGNFEARYLSERAKGRADGCVCPGAMKIAVRCPVHGCPPEMPLKNGKTTTGSGGEFPPPLDPSKNWQWVEPGMGADLAMRKGGGLAFSAVDLARPGSKDKSVMVTGVSREDGTVEVTGERDLEGFAEFHLVACPKVVFTGGSPCHGSGRWTVNEEQRADLEKKSPGTVAAFDGQTCLEAFEDFVESEEKYMPALTAMMAMERRVEVWLEKELAEEREYQARMRREVGRSLDMAVADKFLKEAFVAPTVEEMTKVREWAEGMGILPKDCAHVGRRKVYRAPLGEDPDSSRAVVVEDKCVDCGKEWMPSRLNEPEERLFPAAVEGSTPYRHTYFDEAPRPPAKEVLASEAGPSAVGQRVEGCARCRVRRFHTYCEGCGDRVTSFELRPGESGW